MSRPAEASKHTLQLVEIPIAQIHPHPNNPNVMDDELLAKLEGERNPEVSRPLAASDHGALQEDP